MSQIKKIMKKRMIKMKEMGRRTKKKDRIQITRYHKTMPSDFGVKLRMIKAERNKK